MWGGELMWKRMKNWFMRNRDKREYGLMLSEQQLLMRDIRNAVAEWRMACVRFEHALGTDEVDYAISTLEAAEKRIAMLMKRAKRAGMHALRLGEVL
ncbi:DUF2508 domain-containing protein [Paenibacillus sp. KS1]|nr:DUF2508 domain-containing protein [Paenibacillus sp. KS1]